MTPEHKARASIDALLVAAGRHTCSVSEANIHASTSVATRKFSLNTGFGFTDYLLYVNGQACGVIEAKKQGSTLTGVELQSSRYAQGQPNGLPAWYRPLPLCGKAPAFLRAPLPQYKTRPELAKMSPIDK